MATEVAIRKINKLASRLLIFEQRVTEGIIKSADIGLAVGTEKIKSELSIATGRLVAGTRWERFVKNPDLPNTITGKFVSEQNYYFPHAKFKGIKTKEYLRTPIRREVQKYISTLNIRRLLLL